MGKKKEKLFDVELSWGGLLLIKCKHRSFDPIHSTGVPRICDECAPKISKKLKKMFR